MGAGLLRYVTRHYAMGVLLMIMFLGIMAFGLKPQKSALASDPGGTVYTSFTEKVSGSCDATVKVKIEDYKNAQGNNACYVSASASGCNNDNCSEVCYTLPSAPVDPICSGNNPLEIPVTGTCKELFTSTGNAKGRTTVTCNDGTTGVTGDGDSSDTTDNSSGTCTATLYENGKQVATGSVESPMDSSYFASDAQGAGASCPDTIGTDRASSAYCANGVERTYTAKCQNYSTCAVQYRHWEKPWWAVWDNGWWGGLTVASVFNTTAVSDDPGKQIYEIEAACTPGSNNPSGGGGDGAVTLTPESINLPVGETRTINISGVDADKSFVVKCTHTSGDSGTQIKHATAGTLSGGYHVKSFSPGTTSFEIKGVQAGDTAGQCKLYVRDVLKGTMSVTVTNGPCGTEGIQCCDAQDSSQGIGVNGCAEGLLCSEDDNGAGTCVKDTTPEGVECGGDGEICCVNANNAPTDTNTPKDGCDGDLRCDGTTCGVAEEGTDTDGDGVLDEDDACPAVVGTVENNGCPSDPTTPPAAPDLLFADFLAGNTCASYIEGITANEWNLMTLPFDLANSGVNAISSIIADSVNIWSYAGIGNSYEADNTGVPGEAFWLKNGFDNLCLVGAGYDKVADAVTVSFPADTKAYYEINMTGNPFDKKLSWSQVAVNGKDIQSAFADGTIIGIFTWNPEDNPNNEYDTYYDPAKYSVTGSRLHGYVELSSGTLNPHQGYWLMTKDGAAVTVTYTP